MAAKLIPAAVLLQATALTVDQVQAAMESGGAEVKLSEASFQGMMPSGAFVYQCKGTYFRARFTGDTAAGDYSKTLTPAPFPDYLEKFKVKLVHDPKLLNNIKPEATEAMARAKRRMLADGWAVCWGN